MWKAKLVTYLIKTALALIENKDAVIAIVHAVHAEKADGQPK